MKKENEKELFELIKDIHCFDELNPWIDDLNIFKILKVSETEIRHSNMLVWLLDPNENHGLGSRVLYKFLASLSEIGKENLDYSEQTDCQNTIDQSILMRLMLSDLNQVELCREQDKIDLLIVCRENKVVIAIENKINSKEHTKGSSSISQLEAYEKVLDEKYDDFTKIMIYLTPDGTKASRPQWVGMTYNTIVECIQSAYFEGKNKLVDVQKLIIENYIKTIKNDVICDDEMVAKCNEIYKKHSKAFDLVFNMRNKNEKLIKDIYDRNSEAFELIKRWSNDTRNIISGFIKDELKKWGIKVSSSSQKYICFQTDNLTNIFSKVNAPNNSYRYQVILAQGEGLINCSLGLVFHQEKGNKLEEKVLDLMREFVSDEKISKKITSEEWEWITVRKFGDPLVIVNYKDDKIEGKIKNWIDCVCREIDDKETSVLGK